MMIAVTLRLMKQKNIDTTQQNRLDIPRICMLRVRFSLLRRLAICAAVTSDLSLTYLSLRFRTNCA